MAQHAIRVHGADLADIIGHRLRQIVALPKHGDAVAELGVPHREALLERIHARASMRVDHNDWLVLANESAQ